LQNTPSQEGATTTEPTEKTDPDRPGRPTRPYRIPFVLIGITALAHIIFFLPVGGVSSDIPEVGDISTQEVIAPFTFPILKEKTELEKERRTVYRNVPVVLDFVKEMRDSALGDFDSVWNVAGKIIKDNSIPAREDSLSALFPRLSPEGIKTFLGLRRTSDIEQVIVELLSEIHSAGIFDWKSLSEGDTAHIFNIHWGKKDEIIPAERVTTIEAAREKLKAKTEERFRSYPEKGQLVYELAVGFIRPNLIPDMELTQENRRKSVENVKPVRGMVLKDQRIVDAHERITEETREKLLSLAIAKSGRYSTPPVIYNILRVLARLLLTVMIIGTLAYITRRFIPDTWFDSAKLAVVLAAVWLPGFFAFVFRLAGWPELLTPIAFSATLLSALFGSELAAAVALSSALLIGLAGEGSYSLLMVLIIEGIIAGVAFSGIATRRESFRPIAYTVTASVMAIVVIDFVSFSEFGHLGIHAVSVFAGSTFGILLALALLPVFERFVGVVTRFTLMEYADTNAPVLQQLAIEAPGTFHHSIVVGNLAETAAEAIGANPLLAKVGALYHDIGKLTHPEYFSENLGDYNPHDKLSPHMSFLVLSAHVKEGVRLAKVHNLPEPVVDIIREHHGTSIMSYFYEQAKEQDQSVVEDAFRYPGPKPQTKEAAIVLLADSIEAKVRSMGELNLKSLNKLVKSTIDEKFESGQLSECDLTTHNLTLIREAFIKIMEGVLHKRPNLLTTETSHETSKKG